MAQRTRRRNHAIFFDETDPSAYMLGLPKGHTKLGRWLVFTILTGTALAVALIVLETFLF